MSIDWWLVGAIVLFLTFSESLKDRADRETEWGLKLFLNVASKFIEYLVIGACVVLLLKYYKLA